MKPLKLTEPRASLLRNLANNGGSILWKNINGPDKTTSSYLRLYGLAEMAEAAGSTFQPDALRLKITKAGLDALGRAKTSD